MTKHTPGAEKQSRTDNASVRDAAPDLLAALEDLERLGADDGRYQQGSPLAKAWSAARSAIRKARGNK